MKLRKDIYLNFFIQKFKKKDSRCVIEFTEYLNYLLRGV